MDHIIREVEKQHMKEETPSFQVGDIVRVEYLIKEGKNERVQGTSKPQGYGIRIDMRIAGPVVEQLADFIVRFQSFH